MMLSDREEDWLFRLAVKQLQAARTVVTTSLTGEAMSQAVTPLTGSLFTRDDRDFLHTLGIASDESVGGS